MATGLGEPVYGLSEDEVSGALFSPGIRPGFPWEFLPRAGRGWGIGATLGACVPCARRGPPNAGAPQSGVLGRVVAGSFLPGTPSPPPSALFVNKAARRPWSRGSLGRSPPLGGRRRARLCRRGPPTPRRRPSRPRFPGPFGNFLPLAAAARESMMCVTSGSRLETRGPWNFLTSVSASAPMRVCACRCESG